MSLQELVAAQSINVASAQRERRRKRDLARQSRERPGHSYEAPEHPTDPLTR